MKTKLTRFMLCFLVFAFLFQIRLLAFEQPSRCIRMSASTDLSATSSVNQATVDKLAANYVNEVLVWVKSSAGVKNTGNLNDFIPKAHAAGIKVVLQYTVNQDDAYISTHPGAHVYHSPGTLATPGIPVRPYAMTTTYVNLLYPGYKEFVVNDIASLVTAYDVDGICLENLRYTHMLYSFDTYTLQRAAALGCDTTHLLSFFNTSANYTTYAVTNAGAAFIDLYAANPDPDVVTWVNMRKGVLSEYITAIRAAIENIKPGIQLSALYSEEPALDVQGPGVHYGQDYALHSTLLDVISPYIATTASLPHIILDAVALVDAGCKIIPNFLRTATPNIQINQALDNGSYGVIIEKISTITTADWTVINPLFLAMKTATSIKEVEELSSDFLKQNYPNPFNTTTEIAFQVTKPCLVSLNVYDALGRQVAPLINKKMDSGTYKVNFDAKGLADGVYFYRLNMDGSSSARKMILTK